MIVWVCGRYYKGSPWEILGIFYEEHDARDLCTKDIDFIGPVEINKKLPEKNMEWPGCYYPLKEKT